MMLVFVFFLLVDFVQFIILYVILYYYVLYNYVKRMQELNADYYLNPILTL